MQTLSYRAALAAGLSLLALAACDAGQTGSASPAGDTAAPAETAPPPGAETAAVGAAAAPAETAAIESADASAAMAPPGAQTTDTDETTAWGYVIPAGTPFNIAAAVKAADRTPQMTERDANRKP